ncbi:hybrid sensor histidine kinase/response regulator [Tepidimonas taiwanensis]|uniref:histidine kinase n=2 Tax=Tepidimonas taiwanensis TaxID=307486 RepID=A0A554X3X0_9BURK|nr:ATP-binding protein [Tepidimonas taiwanensis]TSE30503.1 Sensory/regulatory protein RpfC [Tepidimonas taiwanensis]
MSTEPLQRIVRVRRDYNRWVASETMEDYALRYTARRFRRWSPGRVANTALGVSSFLVLEAVGASLLVQFGFVNAAWAIVAAGALIFLIGWPISMAAARHGVDMDLLTRGAGFGYIGSTVTSLIYASFTFIFFALEAAVMAYALELAFGIPPAWGYGVCALVVIPLVIHGITAISRFQVWTQPIWLSLMVVPFVGVLVQAPNAFEGLSVYAGAGGTYAGFDSLAFGTALTVGLALVTQMGEQADYLRFMPPARPGQAGRWRMAVLIGGVGWVLIGVLKMLGGAALAWLAIGHQVPPERAVDPNQMYLVAYEYLLPHEWAVWATALFVVISQLKINVTNAYAGSLAWSNFFSRWTHSHPGRVVWVVFNIGIALLLMEMNVFDAMSQVLGIYANLAIAWMGAVFADLVINKPLGWSPRAIVFQRAYLYDVNPVGLGAMGLASVVGIAAHVGAMGLAAQAFSAVVALVVAIAAAPLLAWLTRGRYYLARHPDPVAQPNGADVPAAVRCVVCGGEYEAPDTAHCPAYQGRICSLCCTLDARCEDLCKPQARVAVQWQQLLHRLLPARAHPYLEAGLAAFTLWMAVLLPLVAIGLALLFRYLGAWPPAGSTGLTWGYWWSSGYLPVLALTSVMLATLVWWVVLAQKSRAVALEESRRQTALLLREIEAHRRTDRQLQQAREQAERARRTADQANRAKTRFIGSLSHELRTPLNAILGYAQWLQEARDLSPKRREAAGVIARAGEHVLSLIEGTLDIARIESGRMVLEPRPTDLRGLVESVVALIGPQARAKQLTFDYQPPERWPAAVRADERRIRQILLNLLGNAVKFTRDGHVALRVAYAREIASFEITDSGPGIDPDERERIFEPFARGRAAVGVPGSGLGLTVARMLTDLMGGELVIDSRPGVGTTCRLRLFLPTLAAPPPLRDEPATPAGEARTDRRGCALVVDNEAADRELLGIWLREAGYDVVICPDGESALEALHGGLRPDFVLMDLAMPGKDGWQTLADIRAMELQPPPRCAVVSANAFDRGIDNPIGLPVVDFLVKPVSRQTLLRWIQGEDGAPGETARASDAVEMAHATDGLAAHHATGPTHEALPQPWLELPEMLRQRLATAARLGHRRGVEAALDTAQAQPGLSAAARQWLRQCREDVREFRFDRLQPIVVDDDSAVGVER